MKVIDFLHFLMYTSLKVSRQAAKLPREIIKKRLGVLAAWRELLFFHC